MGKEALTYFYAVIVTTKRLRVIKMEDVNYIMCKCDDCTNKSQQSGYCVKHHKEHVTDHNNNQYNLSVTNRLEREKILFDENYRLNIGLRKK